MAKLLQVRIPLRCCPCHTVLPAEFVEAIYSSSCLWVARTCCALSQKHQAAPSLKSQTNIARSWLEGLPSVRCRLTLRIAQPKSSSRLAYVLPNHFCNACKSRKGLAEIHSCAADCASEPYSEQKISDLLPGMRTFWPSLSSSTNSYFCKYCSE